MKPVLSREQLVKSLGRPAWHDDGLRARWLVAGDASDHVVLLYWDFVAVQRMKPGERWSAGLWRTHALTSDLPISLWSRVE